MVGLVCTADVVLMLLRRDLFVHENFCIPCEGFGLYAIAVHELRYRRVRDLMLYAVLVSFLNAFHLKGLWHPVEFTLYETRRCHTPSPLYKFCRRRRSSRIIYQKDLYPSCDFDWSCWSRFCAL